MIPAVVLVLEVQPILSETLNHMILTDKDNHKQVTITQGTVLTLKLEAVPGTGYSWAVITNDTKQLRPEGDPVFEPKESDSNEAVLGAPANQVFNFTAQQIGEQKLELHYRRPWEEKAPLKTFEIVVHIR